MVDDDENGEELLDGEELWEHVTRSVDPLFPDRDKGDLTGRGVAPPAKRKKAKARAPAPAKTAKTVTSAPLLPGLDRRTDQRLRQGKIPVEGRLDLHGMSQHEAQKALDRFIHAARMAEKRCVLVITGKGRREYGRDDSASWFTPPPGILRRRVPEWLAGMDGVLRFYPARPRDGGQGALYVLLRRMKTDR